MVTYLPMQARAGFTDGNNAWVVSHKKPEAPKADGMSAEAFEKAVKEYGVKEEAYRRFIDSSNEVYSKECIKIIRGDRKVAERRKAQEEMRQKNGAPPPLKPVDADALIEEFRRKTAQASSQAQSSFASSARQFQSSVQSGALFRSMAQGAALGAQNLGRARSKVPMLRVGG